jgi:hypothetical protein
VAKVGITVQRSDHGFHAGHLALIEYAKQFGDVYVQLVENLIARNHYLRTGQGSPKYQLDTKIYDEQCQALGIKYLKPVYITLEPARRQAAYEYARQTAEKFRSFLLADRYIDQATYAMMIRPSVWADKQSYPDMYIMGPEIVSFFLARTWQTLHRTPIQIYPRIVKDECGLKASHSWKEVPFDKSRIRHVINGVRDRYKVGTNDDLVKELNLSYPPSVGWRVHDILVWDGPRGRLEVTSFTYRTAAGMHIVEEIDYYGTSYWGFAE